LEGKFQINENIKIFKHFQSSKEAYSIIHPPNRMALRVSVLVPLDTRQSSHGRIINTLRNRLLRRDVCSLQRRKGLVCSLEKQI